MLLKVLAVAGVAVLPLPALVLGVPGLFRRSGRYGDAAADRVSLVLLVAVRLITWLLVLALSGITLLAAIGAMVRDLRLPNLVYVFCVLDLLLGSLILLSFGRRDRRPARRRASPAAR